jgi:hypothetical protein
MAMTKEEVTKATKEFKEQLTKQGFSSEEQFVGASIAAAECDISRKMEGEEADTAMAVMSIRAAIMSAERGVDIKQAAIVADLILTHMCKAMGVDPDTIYRLQVEELT